VFASSWLVSVYKHTCILISWVHNVFINEGCFLPVFPRRNFELGSYPYAIHDTMAWQVGRWWVTTYATLFLSSTEPVATVPLVWLIRARSVCASCVRQCGDRDSATAGRYDARTCPRAWGDDYAGQGPPWSIHHPWLTLLPGPACSLHPRRRSQVKRSRVTGTSAFLPPVLARFLSTHGCSTITPLLGTVQNRPGNALETKYVKLTRRLVHRRVCTSYRISISKEKKLKTPLCTSRCMAPRLPIERHVRLTEKRDDS
jgi:hypothetical protein